jgi:lipopolysaccharide biosynthesis glycosyltransferase
MATRAANGDRFRSHHTESEQFPQREYCKARFGRDSPASARITGIWRAAAIWKESPRPARLLALQVGQTLIDASSYHKSPAVPDFVSTGHSLSKPQDPSRPDSSDPIAVLAADEHFAMPLAATVRSALENLSAGKRLQLYILDAGITDSTRQRLLRSWPADRCRVEWLSVDASQLAGSPVSGHVNLVSYYRILIPRVLPSHVRRVIYLDSDLIVRSDLAHLWAHELNGHPCLAVQDCSAPYIDSAVGAPNFAACHSYIGCHEPVPNHRALGLNPRAQYFNAGILLMDLDAWRREDLSDRLLACLRDQRKHVRWWDQYALNVVLNERWGAIDARWNQGSHIYRYPSWQQSPYDRSSYLQQRDDPYIIHFTTRHKPWRPSCKHPLRSLFFECVERTEWAGYRLPRLGLFLEALKVQERRFRHGRRWIGKQAWRLLSPQRGQSPSNG